MFSKKSELELCSLKAARPFLRERNCADVFKETFGVSQTRP